MQRFTQFWSALLPEKTERTAVASPERDWLVVLAIAVLAIVAGIAAGVVLQRLSVAQPVFRAQEAQPSLDPQRLSEALRASHARAEEHAKLLTQSPGLVDPSR